MRRTEESDDDVSAGPYGDYIDYEYIGCYESTDTFGFEHRVTEAEMTHEVNGRVDVNMSIALF